MFQISQKPKMQVVMFKNIILLVMCCDVMWCDVMWYDVMWCGVIRRDFTWCVVSWRGVTWRVVSWHDSTWSSMMWRDVRGRDFTWSNSVLSSDMFMSFDMTLQVVHTIVSSDIVIHLTFLYVIWHAVIRRDATCPPQQTAPRVRASSPPTASHNASSRW